jgi:ABC-type lipoprotein release transport system permease subunit
VIAYFAILAVALCVAMMLIVVSVMNGFLAKVERAAKGLFGDIVLESRSTEGMGLYDEFIAQVHKNVPEVEAASPFILVPCYLRIPGGNWSQIVQAAGIRLPERAAVTGFAKGLFVQAGGASPTFDPPIAQAIDCLDGQIKFIEAQRASLPGSQGDRTAALELETRLDNALLAHLGAKAILRRAKDRQAAIAESYAKLRAAYAESHGEPTDKTEAAEKQLEELTLAAGWLDPSRHIIMGLGIPGLCFRTDEGKTIRFICPGSKVSLSLIPLGSGLGAAPSLNSKTFTIVDDCQTDVSSIDSGIVYVPFETLQQLNNMAASYSADKPGELAIPARCNQIHIKVRSERTDEQYLETVRAKVERQARDFHDAHPEAMMGDVAVQTWRQRQAVIVGPIEKQRTLTVIMFGIISLVAVVLIFVIFYMIVFQKTKDIGVLKAVGAGSFGVAQIFLAYGAAIGLVGAMVGTVGGYYFVRYINPIQDAVDRWFGFRVWDREFFMFEKIPNEVEVAPALLIVAGAIVAGLLGALIPAWRAARMQPVEALRYE